MNLWIPIIYRWIYHEQKRREKFSEVIFKFKSVCLVDVVVFVVFGWTLDLHTKLWRNPNKASDNSIVKHGQKPLSEEKKFFEVIFKWSCCFCCILTFENFFSKTSNTAKWRCAFYWNQSRPRIRVESRVGSLPHFHFRWDLYFHFP